MSELGPLDTTTPREYLEACKRIINLLEKIWDELPDGDKGSPDDENQTKTDMFIILASCADYGRTSIKEQNEVKRLLTF